VSLTGDIFERDEDNGSDDEGKNGQHDNGQQKDDDVDIRGSRGYRVKIPGYGNVNVDF
jgi:hypothetical protein